MNGMSITPGRKIGGLYGRTNEWDRMSWERWNDLKKAACLFAGMNHMQPLLLATLIVACTGIGITRCSTASPDPQGAQSLVTHTRKEELIRDIISIAILFLISLGYIQIFYAFTSGGKKGHMHWFYVSLMFQQFVCLLIGGAIGFWEGGITLWYLVTLPLGPVVVFFYQLYIHSWIRNNGPRDAEYLVVEYQIWLVLCISYAALTFWVATYSKPIIPIEVDLTTIDTVSSEDNIKVTKEEIVIITVTTGNSKNALTLATQSINSQGQTKTLALTIPLDNTASPSMTINIPITLKPATLVYDTPGETAQSLKAGGSVTAEANVPLTLALTTGPPSTKDIKVKSVTLTLRSEKPGVTAKVTAQHGETATVHVPATLTLNSENSGKYITKDSTVTATITIPEITLVLQSDQPITGITKDSVIVNFDGANANLTEQPKTLQYTYKTFTPNEGYCIFSVKDTGNARDIWASGGRKCLYAEFYSSSGQSKLLHMAVYSGKTLNTNLYFGTEDTSASADNNKPWKEISEDEFIEKLPALATGGTLSLPADSKATDQYNRY